MRRKRMTDDGMTVVEWIESPEGMGFVSGHVHVRWMMQLIEDGDGRDAARWPVPFCRHDLDPYGDTEQ